MAHRILITPFAHDDEFEAFTWYENEQPGLGDQLLNELEIAYQKIANNPEHYGFIDEKKELRDFLIRRFPYVVVFRIMGETVEAIAVHHAKKHPAKKHGKWSSRKKF